LLDEIVISGEGSTKRIVYRFQDGELFLHYEDGQIDSYVDVVLVSGDNYEPWKFLKFGNILSQIKDLV
jgi:hypothetical protein